MLPTIHNNCAVVNKKRCTDCMLIALRNYHFKLIQFNSGLSCEIIILFIASTMVLPFWCRLTRIVLNKIQEGRKMVVCVCVCVCKDYGTRIFIARCCASIVYVVMCLSYHSSLSHANNATQYPRDSNFLMPTVSAKFEWGHPLWGCQMQVRYVKISHIRQITCYHSKTQGDRCIVSVNVE